MRMNLSIGQVKSLYYKEGLSAREAGEKLGVSVWQVMGFMKKHKLPRRSAAETNKLNFIRTPRSFKIKSALTNKEKELKTAGLMLYWGEGTKTSEDTVDLANSDPQMIKLFLRVLREIYGVREERLRVLLYCYANQNIRKLIDYWVKTTKIPQERFSKPYVRKDFLEKKKNKMAHGLVHIRYSDKRLVAIIKEDIKKFLKRFVKPE